MGNNYFTPLEETISFYTRNDFAILNNWMIGDEQMLWRYAEIAYRDNQGILDEYESGLRQIKAEYDIKWINSLRKRLIDQMDEAAKEKIVEIAKADIENILEAMTPSKKVMHLYRTAWIDKDIAEAATFSFSREYKGIAPGKMFEVKTFSSFSMTPYREDDDVGSDFYRYELKVAKGTPILELDQFETHNEEGEVILPPMKFRVIGVRKGEKERCRGVIMIESEMCI